MIKKIYIFVFNIITISLQEKSINKGIADDKDVTSLLIYLANKGYIKISENEGKSKGFKITKLKEYDGDNVNEQIFLDGLFAKKGSKSTSKNEVTLADLDNIFYITILMVKSNITK